MKFIHESLHQRLVGRNTWAGWKYVKVRPGARVAHRVIFSFRSSPASPPASCIDCSPSSKPTRLYSFNLSLYSTNDCQVCPSSRSVLFIRVAGGLIWSCPQHSVLHCSVYSLCLWIYYEAFVINLNSSITDVYNRSSGRTASCQHVWDMIWIR